MIYILLSDYIIFIKFILLYTLSDIKDQLKIAEND